MNPTSLRAPLLCMSLLALAACGDKAPPPKPPPPEVGVVTIQSQNAPLTKDLVGRLSPFRTADVRARVSGVLLKRTYDEGTDVKAGQKLFQIDPAPLQASLNSSLAMLASARATATNDQVNAKRISALAPKGYVSKSDLDNAQASQRTSSASVKQAQADVDNARINLGYASVVSPIAGRAGQQQVTEGALVGASGTTLLTTVDQIDPLYVNFTLSSESYNRLRQQQTKGDVTLSDQAQTHVQITLPDGSTYDQQGTLDFSGTSINQVTGAITLRASLPNPDRSLLPGQFVNLKLNLGQQHHVFLVPQQAIQRDTQGAFAMEVGQDGKVVRKDVTADQAAGSNWVISGGLKGGEKVIVSGLQSVKEGQPAKAKPWSPQDEKGKGGQGEQGQGPGASGSAAGKNSGAPGGSSSSGYKAAPGASSSAGGQPAGKQ